MNEYPNDLFNHTWARGREGGLVDSEGVWRHSSLAEHLPGEGMKLLGRGRGLQGQGRGITSSLPSPMPTNGFTLRTYVYKRHTKSVCP